MDKNGSAARDRGTNRRPRSVIIHGFGRIGKCVARAYANLPSAAKSNYRIVGINSRGLTAENASYFMRYDSTHGRMDECSVKTLSDGIDWGDGLISISAFSDLSNLSDIDIILDCTGEFNQKQLLNSATNPPKIILSAPHPAPALTVIFGVNEDIITEQHNLISAGSCTTNCLAPIVSVLQRHIGIKSAFMTTVHAYTNDQHLLDSRHSDLRRGRAAGLSIIPTSTGAAKNISLIFPELEGKMDGVALRIPTHNVSLVDLKFMPSRPTTAAEINEIMAQAHRDRPTIFGLNTEKLVSVDFNHRAESTIFDTTQTSVLQDGICRVASWYDNEWGFANRMLDICSLVASQ